MDFFKDYRVKFIGVLVLSLAILTGGVLGYGAYKNRPSFKAEFESAVNISQVHDKLSVGYCQNVRSSVKIVKNQVFININNDIMSGFICGEAPNKGIIVCLPDKRLELVLNRILMEDMKTEAVIVSSLNNSIILTKSPDCEDITSFLAKIQSEQ